MFLDEKSPSTRSFINKKHITHNPFKKENKYIVPSNLKKCSLTKGKNAESPLLIKDGINKFTEAEEILLIEKEKEHVKNLIQYLKSKTTKGSKILITDTKNLSGDDFSICNFNPNIKAYIINSTSLNNFNIFQKFI